MSSLFRPAALQAFARESAVVVPWSVPDLRCWAWLILLWLLASLLFTAQLTYADKVTVNGVVQPAARPVVVAATGSGVVGRIDVRLNEQVDVDQALVLIDARDHLEDGATPVALKLNELEDRRAALRAERVRIHQLHTAEADRLAHQIRSTAERLETMARQRELIQHRVTLLRTDTRRQAQLAEAGWLSTRDLQRGEADLLQAEQSLLDHSIRMQALADEREQLISRHGLHEVETEDRLARVEAELVQLDHTSAQLSRNERHQLVAPVRGRVVDISTYPGQAVVAGSVLLTLAPDSPGLHPVEVFLPSEAAAQVREGMPVRLRYAGYPFQQYGAAHGEVSSISEVVAPREGMPVFRALIRVLQLPDAVSQVPAGMMVQADIVLASQTLWAWLTEPLREALARL